MILGIFKGGDKNDPRNYRAIMINVVLAKLIGGIMERKVSKWAEDKGKRDNDQAGFCPKHSTIDHCISLTHTIETTWDKKGKYLWYCFVDDFKKSFDIVLREKLWERLVEMGVPDS